MTIDGLTRFRMRQRITMMVNRYEFHEVRPDGSEGRLFGFAEQKRLALKEQVTIYTDAGKSQVICAFKARSVLDFGAGYDVTDGAGQQIGWFKKEFGQSLLRSTWRLGSSGGLTATGTERRAAVALVRRVWDLIPIIGEIPVPFLFHFDFTDPNGRSVMSSTKRMALRDSYLVELPQNQAGHGLDVRVAMAMSVALDALQGR